MDVVETRADQPDDYDSCRALWVELTEHHRLIYDAPSIGGDDPGADWDRHLENPALIGSWVAVEDGNVIGLAGLQTTDQSGVEVEPMIVSMALRGRGVGRLLMDRMSSECIDRRFTSLSVRSVARNTGARKAWHAMGFTTAGMVELFMDLSEKQSTWRPGVVIDGIPFDC